MVAIKLPELLTHESFAEVIASPRADGDGNVYKIHVPHNCFVFCSGMALMCAWGQDIVRHGHQVDFYGDAEVMRYLARMDLFKVLNVACREDFQRHAEAGRFIPLHKVESTKDCLQVINLIGDLVLHNFDNAREFFPAMEWAVNEVMDNITIHSETPVPGVVCAQYFPERKRIDIGICDMGRGVLASLSERYQLWSHGDAITKALQRGVTRNTEVGQGNGLAGTLQIAKVNQGTFQIWSGNASYNGVAEKFTVMPQLPGTGIFLSLDTTKPVNLRTDTFIGESQFGDNESTYIFVESERVTTGDGLMVKDECFHTGSRPPALALRRKILAILPDVDTKPLLINFAGVKSASSSFLDELLARLVVELGVPTFKNKVKVVNVEQTIRDMAQVVINQRLQQVAEQQKNSGPSSG